MERWAMKTYSKASRTRRVSAAAYWPLDGNRKQLFDSSGSAAANSSNPSVCLEPTETSNRKKSTVGRRVRTAKKSVVTVVSLKENCDPSEEPARRGKVVSGLLRRNVQPDSETSSSNSAMSASCSEVEPKETSKRKKSTSVGSRRVRATKRQAMKKAPSGSIPQTNEPASVALPRPAQFVTHRRGAARLIASIPLPNLDSSDEFVLRKGVSNGQLSRRCKARVTFTFSPESSVNDTVQSHRRSAIRRRVCQQSSISEAEDQTVEPYHRKPLFCSTPSLQLVGKRPGVSAAAPPVSPLDLSAPEELVPSGDHFSPPLSAPLREPGSGCKTLPIITEAPDMHETPSLMLFSNGSDSVSSYRSVSRELEMLIDALKDMCLSKRCQVQLERVDKLLPQTPYVSCLGYSSSDLCPQTTEEPQMVESGQTANHLDRLCPGPPCHVTDYAASLIDDQSGHPPELVTDTFHLFLSGNSSQSVAQCDSDNTPSVTDVHTSSLAHSVEHSVTDVHTSSLAHSVEHSVTDVHTSSLAHSVEHSVTDVHTSSLAHSVEHSVTDIHTSSLAHSVECNQSVASVQSAHQVDDNIESVTDAWPVDNSSYVVVDQQQFSKQVPEDKAAMIIARLKEECLAKKSTVPLKRLTSTQGTGTHGHGMHSEHTASENGSTRSEDMTADAKECVQNPNERRPKKVSRATKETKRRSASRDRPGTARKAFVSGLSVSRWRDKGQTQHSLRGRSKAGDSSITGHHNTSKVVNEGLLHGSGIFSTPVRALPSHLDLSSLLANLTTPETHTWSRLKARLSVHRRVTVRMTPRKLQSSVLESSGRAGQVDGSMDLFDMHAKTHFSKWVQSQLPNSSTFLSICEGAEDDLSDAEKVYAECNQQGALCWEECILPERLKRCKKIGEGTFGEVFSTVDASGDTVALKIIPIEGKEKVNGEEQKTFGDILHEMIISKELSSLKEKQHNQTYGFIGLHGLHCVKGSYPAVMLKAWDAFDRQKRSENDRPDFFEDEQLFLILEFEFGGSDLENSNGKLSSLAVARSILHQVTAALAVAEQQLCFEHRDLHWGNILVKATKEKSTSFLLDGIEHCLDTKGVLVRIIDYSLSRMEIDGLTVSCDISEDEELFMGQGDYQFDIYRLMREQNSNKWDDYQPHSNVLWLHYLCSKLLSMKYRSKGGCRAKDTREELGRIHDNLLQCRSATEALQSGLF